MADIGRIAATHPGIARRQLRAGLLLLIVLNVREPDILHELNDACQKQQKFGAAGMSLISYDWEKCQEGKT